MPDLNELLSPKSIAIVGASSNPQKIGNIVLKNIQQADYQGKIYPINPKETQINNLHCYQKISDLPEVPDLTIVSVPNTTTIDLLPEIGVKGCKNLLIFTAGFKEAGESGKELEAKLLEICQKYDFNLIGPNCLGFVNTNQNLNATFGQTVLQKGNLSILSQSGAIATSFFDWAKEHSLGFEYFVTLGNKSVLNENDLLEFLKNKPKPSPNSGESQYQPIGLYLESIANGQEFIKICKQFSADNPIFLLKPGKSQAAATAMQSHTGSLAGSDDALNAALKETGIVRADTLEDFFDLSKALSWENTPKGNTIAIISNAGGPGVISADAISTTNLKLAELSNQTKQILKENLPRMAGLHNPIDVLGDALADRFSVALEAVLKEENIFAVLVILTPQLMTQIQKTAEAISTLSEKYQKTIYTSFMGANQVEKGIKVLNQAKIPNFSYPEQALKIMSKAYDWQNWRNNQTHDGEEQTKISYPSLADDLLKQSQNKLLETTLSYQVLEELRINQPKSVTTNNLQIAEESINSIGWPIVLKLSEANLVHKTEKGGVITGISSYIDLKKHWQNLSLVSNTLQIQQQIKPGFEVLIGFKRDSTFGNLLFFGAGGKYANLIADKNLCLFPLSQQKIIKLIESSKIKDVFYGYRNSLPVNLLDFTEQVLKLAKLFERSQQIKELEINPVIINEDGFYFVDPKIIF